MTRPLKKDALGAVCIVQRTPPMRPEGLCVRRDTAAARAWLRPVARHLAAHELEEGLRARGRRPGNRLHGNGLS